jgi:hypothetical protein
MDQPRKDEFRTENSARRATAATVQSSRASTGCESRSLTMRMTSFWWWSVIVLGVFPVLMSKYEDPMYSVTWNKH